MVAQVLRLTNLVPEFLAFWERCRGLRRTDRSQVFRNEVVPIFPSFYKEVLRRPGGHIPSGEARLTKALDDFAEIETLFRAIAARLPFLVLERLEDFRRTFPTFRCEELDVWIVHSLGELDGGTREIEGRLVLIFGVDVMASVHRGVPSHPFFAHEFLHAFHEPLCPPSRELWTVLWEEGLATYVSSVLYPGSSAEDLMLDYPKGLIASCEALKPQLWRELAAKLESVGQEDHDAFFKVSSGHPWIPIRAGYVLGERIVRHVAQSRSLEELATLSGAPLHRVLARAISDLQDEGTRSMDSFRREG